VKTSGTKRKQPEPTTRTRGKNWALEDNVAFLISVKKHSNNFVAVLDDMKDQHRTCVENQTADKLAKKFNNLNCASSEYKKPFKRATYTPAPKRSRLDKETEVQRQAAHAENETNREKLHNQVCTLLEDLRAGEVVGDGGVDASEESLRSEITEAGKARKTAREEKQNKWLTASENEAVFRSKIVDLTETFSQHMGKAVELQEKLLACFLQTAINKQT